jgi:protein-S-isoprenylcysteine O-methyltransferase Ste14
VDTEAERNTISGARFRMRRAGLEAIALLAFLGTCLFASAGRISWGAAWLYLAIFAAFTAATFLLVQPELIRERAAPAGDSDRTDALLASAGFLGLYPGTLIAAGLDAGRQGPAVPVLVQGIAFIVFTSGYAFALWGMRVNPFFSTFIRIQSERGHAVIRSGPYAWVRHPGYAGAIVSHLALPLALGSTWALVPALLGSLLFVVRAAREDRVLAERLPGYREYQARVRWRLAPGVW